MSRYGTFKYGAAKYGTATNANLLWGLEVDWDNDGAFTGASEAGYLRAVSITRGRSGLFTGEGQPGRQAVGQCILTLDNSDRRFDPWYSSSALYPNVQPGRDVRLRVKNGSSGSLYDVFRGRIADVPRSQDRLDPTVQLVVYDGWRMLADRRSTVALQTNTTMDLLISAVLTDVSWPSAWGSDLDTGSDTIPYAWVEDQSAFDALHEMVESEMGLGYVGADGKFYFVSRQNLELATSSLTLDQAEVMNAPAVSNPWDLVRNKISVRAYPRSIASSAEIWRLNETRYVRPGASATIWAKFHDSNYDECIAQSVAAPVATTDYTMNTDAGGLGTNLTASFSVTATIFAASAKLVVTNNGSVGGYITLLKIRGAAIQLLNVTAAIAEDTTSQASYGRRQLSLDLPFQQNTATAEDFANWLLSLLKDPAPMVQVELVNRPATQFGYDLGTNVHFTCAYLGLDKVFRIGQIRHDTGRSMQHVRTVWTLEPISQQTDYWQLGTADHGELGTHTRLAF